MPLDSCGCYVATDPNTGNPTRDCSLSPGLDKKDSESLQLTAGLPSSEDCDSTTTGGRHSLVEGTPDHPHVTLEAAAGQATTLLRDLRTLWRHPVYVIACLATSIYTGTSLSTAQCYVYDFALNPSGSAMVLY
jgi:hypothetical protein